MRFSSKLSLLAVVATASTVVQASPMTNVAAPVDAKDDALMARGLPGNVGVASHKDARQVPSGAPSPSLPTAGGVPSASGAPSMRREGSVAREELAAVGEHNGDDQSNTNDPADVSVDSYNQDKDDFKYVRIPHRTWDSEVPMRKTLERYRPFTDTYEDQIVRCHEAR
ncbi:uncharacterized protein STEHIDRAFT_111492 [Stereum hirsutum FP-91666 SS1]|uniref:uncharacterized protein n=1 Tax=Stereum hirsutum (strain FP-91666) TaxID=721885 RepID=UPI000444A733|nr:uncharacterized protein STEHIDRAFT_111492 [Stereum hirsutum FP-91666 SS1]EIM85905.1 hypothetical protein STEHIDRAFT_111492 [Stereum hirsutum FP-91666 SS1]